MRTKWLLLLNNADGTTAKDVFEILPRVGGDIIITTRESVPLSMATVVLVDKMQEEEAILLLLNVKSMDSVDRENTQYQYVQKIVTELDFMPLAINLARAYINNTRTSFKAYLKM